MPESSLYRAQIQDTPCWDLLCFLYNYTSEFGEVLTREVEMTSVTAWVGFLWSLFSVVLTVIPNNTVTRYCWLHMQTDYEFDTSDANYTAQFKNWLAYLYYDDVFISENFATNAICLIGPFKWIIEVIFLVKWNSWNSERAALLGNQTQSQPLSSKYKLEENRRRLWCNVW